MEGLGRSSHASRPPCLFHQVSIPVAVSKQLNRAAEAFPLQSSALSWCLGHVRGSLPYRSTAGRDHNTEAKENLHTMEQKYINLMRGHCSWRGPRPFVQLRVHSELNPLELLLTDSEELLLVSFDGSTEGADPGFSFLVGFLLFSCLLTSCSRFSSSFFFS